MFGIQKLDISKSSLQQLAVSLWGDDFINF